MITSLIEYMVKKMAQYPEHVLVKEISIEQGMVLEIHLDERDRGRIIGKKGLTIKSLRSIAHAIEPHTKILIDIVQPSA